MSRGAEESRPYGPTTPPAGEEARPGVNTEARPSTGVRPSFPTKTAAPSNNAVQGTRDVVTRGEWQRRALISPFADTPQAFVKPVAAGSTAVPRLPTTWSRSHRRRRYSNASRVGAVAGTAPTVGPDPLRTPVHSPASDNNLKQQCWGSAPIPPSISSGSPIPTEGRYSPPKERIISLIKVLTADGELCSSQFL